MSNNEQSYEAMVEKVMPKGPHGPYGIARSEGIEGSITFSLNQPVWQNGNEKPDPGTYVFLSGIYKKRAGWRASHARLVTPEDVPSRKFGR